MSMISRQQMVTSGELSAFRKDSKLVEGKCFSKDGSLELDNWWDELKFILEQLSKTTGANLAKVIISNQPIGKSLGYGEPTYLTPEEVRSVSEELTKIDLAKLKETAASFTDDPNQGMYPSKWSEKEIQVWIDTYLDKLIRYYQKASAEDKGVIQCIV